MQVKAVISKLVYAHWTRHCSRAQLVVTKRQSRAIRYPASVPDWPGGDAGKDAFHRDSAHRVAKMPARCYWPLLHTLPPLIRLAPGKRDIPALRHHPAAQSLARAPILEE